MIKYLISYGFAIFYTILLIGEHTIISFFITSPILVIITVYNDFKYRLRCNIGVVVENILFCLYYHFTNQGTSFGIDSIFSQLLITLLTYFCSISISKTNIDINNRKVNRINEEKKKLSNVLNNIIDKSESITLKVSNINDEINVLESSSINAKNSISEINQISTDTATAIQNQLLKTEEIQNHIGTVKRVSDTITSNILESKRIIIEGQSSIDNLINYGKIKKDSSAKAKNEISNLATQTQNATQEIT